MIMAVGERSDLSFTYFSVNLDSGQANKIGSISRGSSEDDARYYSAYITAVGADGKTVLRLGYKQVTEGKGPGLGVTSLTSPSSATWNKVPAAPGEEFYYSLVRSKGDSTFLSLAPSEAFNHTFAVVEWSSGGDAGKVIAHIADSHPPESKDVGVLGYVADTANSNVYVALTVQKNPSVLPGLKDRWEIIVVDRTSGAGASTPITGKNFDLLGAETVSCSGVGILGA